MIKLYEVVFYSGDGLFPAYYIIDEIACKNIEKELKNKLAIITKMVRKKFFIGDEIPDWKIYELLYVLQDDSLISIKNIN